LVVHRKKQRISGQIGRTSKKKNFDAYVVRRMKAVRKCFIDVPAMAGTNFIGAKKFQYNFVGWYHLGYFLAVACFASWHYI
jgi:hypothetical protein